MTTGDSRPYPSGGICPSTSGSQFKVNPYLIQLNLLALPALSSDGKKGKYTGPTHAATVLDWMQLTHLLPAMVFKYVHNF